MPGEKGPTKLCLLSVSLSIMMASSKTLQITPVPQTPRVGENVIFIVTGIEEGIRSSEWFRGNGTATENQIIRYNNNDDSKDKGDKFFQDADILKNGSLVILNVTKAYQDIYTVSIQGDSELHEGTVSLIVNVSLSIMMASSNTLQITTDPPTPRVGDNVTFNVAGINERIRSSEWFRGNGTATTNQIIRYNNNDNSKDKGNEFFQDADILQNGSLVISNVQTKYGGIYTVSIQGDLKLHEGTVSLTVHEPVTATSPKSLSGGAIAGIVIGVLAVVIAVVGGVIYALKSKESG